MLLSNTNKLVDCLDLDLVQNRLRTLSESHIAHARAEYNITTELLSRTMPQNIAALNRARLRSSSTVSLFTKKARAKAKKKNHISTLQIVSAVHSSSSSGGRGGRGGPSSSVHMHKFRILYLLRTWQIRQLKLNILRLLNYFRSIEGKMTTDMHGLAFEDKFQLSSQYMRRTVHGSHPTPLRPFRSAPTKGTRSRDSHSSCSSSSSSSRARINVHPDMYSPQDYDTSPDVFMQFEGIESREDTYKFGTDGCGDVKVYDPFGQYIMYDAALSDMKRLEHTLLRLATAFLTVHLRRTYVPASSSKSGKDPNDLSVPDRWALLCDLYEDELKFQCAKRNLLTSYLYMYEHAFNHKDQHKIAQCIIDVIALRPSIDLTLHYFSQSYHKHTECLNLQAALLIRVVSAQIAAQRKVSKQLYQDDWRGFTRFPKRTRSSASSSASATTSLRNCAIRIPSPCARCIPSTPHTHTHTTRFDHHTTSTTTTGGIITIQLLDTFPSACKALDVQIHIESVLSQLCKRVRPTSEFQTLCLYHALLQHTVQVWTQYVHDESKSTFSTTSSSTYGLRSQMSLVALLQRSDIFIKPQKVCGELSVIERRRRRQRIVCA